MVDYATVDDVRVRLGITDTADDDAIASAVSAASAHVDDVCGRRFSLDASASARTINPRGRIDVRGDGDRLLVDDIGDTTGLTVEVGRDSWTDITTSVDAEPLDATAKGRPVTALWYRHGRYRELVRVTAVWGWPAVPDVVVEATIIQAVRLFKRKDSPTGVLGFDDFGAVRLGRVDPDVHALIGHLMTPGFG